MKKIIGILLVLGISSAVHAQTCGFDRVDFGFVTFQSAEDINDRGVIVGSREGDADQYPAEALVWQNGSLSVLPGLGGENAWAHAINNKGQVAGMATDLNHSRHAVIWNDGVPTKLHRIVALPPGTVGGTTGDAVAINDRGEAVGWSRTADDKLHAVLWRANGKIIDLNTTLGAEQSQATAINYKGQVVGSAYFAAPALYRAFLYEAGTVQWLGSPARSTRAGDINDRGQVVVGSSGIGNGQHRAVTWTNGVVTRIGTIKDPLHRAEWVDSYATAINAKGQVLGVSDFADDPYNWTRPWRWKRKC